MIKKNKKTKNYRLADRGFNGRTFATKNGGNQAMYFCYAFSANATALAESTVFFQAMGILGSMG